MKFLFITSNRIGDAVLSTGLLSHVLDQWPNSEVTIACGPATHDLFLGVPGLERILVMQKAKWAGHWLRLWRQVLATRWDKIIDLRASLLSYGLRAKQRFVYHTPGDDSHRVVQLARVYGCDVPPAPRLWTLPSHEAAAQQILAKAPQPLVIGPTANWHGKEWPGDRFATVVRTLLAPGAPLAGYPVLVLGAAGEQVTGFFENLADTDIQVHNLIGQVDLLTAFAVLKSARLYIGNDSGLMHMAAASGCPTLGLFGPSKDQHYRPWGSRCSFVRTPESFDDIVTAPGYDTHKQVSWMETLPVDRVVDAAKVLMMQK